MGYEETQAHTGRCIRTHVYRRDGYQKYVNKRDVFAGCTTAIYESGSSTQEETEISYNGFDDALKAVGDPDPPIVDGDPFQTNPNGSYYLKPTCQFRDEGVISAVDAGLSTRTTVAATAANGRMKTADITQYEVWSPIEREDESTVDLGYHYDAVDYVIQDDDVPLYVRDGTPANPVFVSAMPGITVAFSHDIPSPLSNSLAAWNGGGIAFRGTGREPIRFSGTLACGDWIGGGAGCQVIPGLTEHFAAVSVLETGFGQIEYCTFENGYYSLWVKSPVPPIIGCRFSGCAYGIVDELGTSDETITSSCLFRDISQDAIYSAASGGIHPLKIANCTFYRVKLGIEFNGPNGQNNREVRNCIFVENEYGIFAYEPPREHNNCFWQNTSNANFDLEWAPPNVYQNPQFEDTEAPDLYARFHLNQDGPSPCINAGDDNENDGDPKTNRFLSTALDERLDIGNVDIGYHYPSRGLLRVNPDNFFFQFENGEFFYPIAVFDAFVRVAYTLDDPETPENEYKATFWDTTVPGYLRLLKRHGVNQIVLTTGGHDPADAGELTRSHPERPPYLHREVKGAFEATPLAELEKYLQELDNHGLCYSLMLYAFGEMEHFGHAITESGDNCIYLKPNRYDVVDDTDASVPIGWRGAFFREDDPEGTPDQRTARADFKEYRLKPFVQEFSRNKGLVGWDVFSEIDILEIGYPWYEGEAPNGEQNPLPVYNEDGENVVDDPPSIEYIQNWRFDWHETTLAGGYLESTEPPEYVNGWVPDMLGYVESQETNILGNGLARLHIVGIENLRRFNTARDPDFYDPDYLNDSLNSYIDYHMYTQDGEDRLQSGWSHTEGPEDHFSPVRFYLGLTPVVTASADGTARSWLDSDGSQLTTFTGNLGQVNCAAFSPGGTSITTANSNGTAILWDAAEGTQLTTFTGHTAAVNCVAFSPNGARLVTGSNDYKAIVWDVSDATQLTTFTLYPGAALSVAFSPDGTEVLTGTSDGYAKIWNVSSGTLTWTSDLHDDAVYSAVFSPDAAKVLTGSTDEYGYGIAKLWDIDTGYEDQVFSGHGEGAVRSVAFSPDGEMVLTGCDDGTARLWNVDTGELIRTFLHNDAVLSVDFAPGGSRLLTATGASEGIARIWRVADGAELTSFTGHTGAVKSINISRCALVDCSLPEIIDHYRHNEPEPEPQHRLGGFFSSGFELMDYRVIDKRLLNECYHNYLWLGFVSGSVGGPAPDHVAGQHHTMLYYDVGGQYYINPNPIGGFYNSLNCLTDEILDSMLSLSRFTSLVRWEHVKANYRPMRSHSPQKAVLLKADGSDLFDTEWLWTGASDGTITVGWILYNYDQDHGVPEWEEWTLHPEWERPQRPRLVVSGLDATQLELVWFDDHKGTIVGDRPRSTAGYFSAQAPATATDPLTGNPMFNKSIAFLIQPVGFTPEKHFAELPNELICQIYVEGTTYPDLVTWDEERPEAAKQQLKFTAVTKPPISDNTRYRFKFYFDKDYVACQEPENDNEDFVLHTPPEPCYDAYEVKLEIEDKQQQNKRVGGDIINLKVSGAP